VFTIRRIHSPAIGCVLACALLVSAISGTAAAQSSDVHHYWPGSWVQDGPGTQSAARAQERYYASYGEPQPIDAGTAAARAQERYYSSYREPEPLTLPQPPSPSDDTPWLPIALSIAVGLALVTASATHLRRLRIRRRHAARVTT
jgi:hypothetical protein